MSDQLDTQPAASAAPPRMPRWVKVLIAVGAVVAVVVVVMLAVGGEHSPQRHFGGDNVPEHTPPPGITHGEQP
jgi:hypothetical protein